MLNLNELNSIVYDIQGMEKDIETKNIEPVIDSCIARHNECVDMLLEVKKFLETSFPQFVALPNAKNAWRKVETYHSPCVKTNPYNCVRCYPYGSGIMCYWVDETIGFHMDSDGKVNSIGIMGDMSDDVKYNQYFQLDTHGLPSLSFEKWNRDTTVVRQTTKLDIEKLRQAVDLSYNRTKMVVERLPVFLKKISESVMTRRDTMNQLLDKAKAVKKKTIKIEITED